MVMVRGTSFERAGVRERREGEAVSGRRVGGLMEVGAGEREKGIW